MLLTGPQLETLRDFITEAFNEDSLPELVRLKLGADMFKKWASRDGAFKYVVLNLLNALEEEGIIVMLIDAVLKARSGKDGIEAIQAIRDSLNSPTPTTSEQIGAVRLGVEGVASKINVAGVRAIVIESQEVLSGLADQITLLKAYKSLHDSLHNAKMQFGSLDSSAKQMAKDPNAAGDFSNVVASLETLPAFIDDAIQGLPATPVSIRQDEAEWAARFNTAITNARRAADDIDPISSRQTVQDIRSILRQEPSRIDGKLSRTAEALELSKLKELFSAAASLPDLAEEAASLTDGRNAAEQLQRKVKAQVNQHSDWQGIDRSMSGADNIMRLASAEDPWDFDALWKTIKEATVALVALDPTSKWAADLSTIIAKVDASRTNVDWKKLNADFLRFCQLAANRFLVVDLELKKMAGEVDVIGAPLHDLLSLL